MKRRITKTTLLSFFIASLISTSSQALSLNAFDSHKEKADTKEPKTVKEKGWQGEANDAWIDGKVEASFLFNGSLNNFTINTDVKNGVVTLRGEVDTQMDSTLAREIAEGVEGVKEVNNEIEVVRDGIDYNADDKVVLVDAKIENVIKNRLLSNTRVSGTTINVDVEGLSVTLSGSVRSEMEREIALEIAINADDVVSVTDELTISLR